MTVINNATLILKDSQGNEGIVKSFTNNDITKISNAITDVGKVVDPVTHMPIEATKTSAGVVQLATAQDITNGTAGKVVDAKELADAIGDKATKAEVAEIAEKSNAITVSDTAPNVANMPIASGVMHPSQNIITENPDVSILALQQNLWAYDSTKTYAVGSYVFDENKDICKCIQANGPTNIHAPTDAEYWLRVALNNELADYLPLAGGNITGNLTVQNKNVVRSVNSVNADAEGNVNVTSPVVDYSSGIDIAYRHAGVGEFPRVTIPQDGLIVLYGNSAYPVTEEAYVVLRVMNDNTIIFEQAANQPIEGNLQLFASINLPIRKGQQVECAVTGNTKRICRLYPYIME